MNRRRRGLYIANLIVHPDHRRYGHASRLLDSVLARARSAKVPVWLHVAAGKKAAIILCEKKGFERIEKVPPVVAHPTRSGYLMGWTPPLE